MPAGCNIAKIVGLVLAGSPVRALSDSKVSLFVGSGWGGGAGGGPLARPGGRTGGAEPARLSLPDSSRTVSRFHAHVSCSDDAFFLEEMGSRNVATINGKAVKVGNKAPLRPGDQVKIGHFTLAVGFDDPEFPATPIIDRGSLPSDRAESDDGTQVVVREVFRA